MPRRKPSPSAVITRSVPSSCDVEPAQRADGGPGVRSRDRERREIARPDETRRGLRIAPTSSGSEASASTRPRWGWRSRRGGGGRRRSCRWPSSGRGSRVLLRRRQDPNVFGQLRVQGTRDSFEGKRGRASGRSTCATCAVRVDAGVRAARAVDPNLRLRHFIQRIFQDALDRARPGAVSREAPAPATLRRKSPDTPARAGSSRARLSGRRAIVRLRDAAPPARRCSSPRSSAACRASRRSRDSRARSCA